MPSIIHVLDDTTINQIAAGEVIENPSSVIKELIENSLDAEATSILIEVQGSGRLSICVTDNGLGMTQEDALLCFQRHATSKVYKIEDLDQLSSMGFRGEALPSIASIAKVRLKTKQRDQTLGTFVEIQGGKILSCASIPCENGTSIEVSDLFYNVPARRKFLKSVKQDLVEIQKIVTQIAFGNVLVHFQLINDGVSILDAPLVASHLERSKQFLHENVFSEMVPFEYVDREMKMEGLIGSPSLHRPNRTGQSIFINQRPVFSWEIAQSVLQGYGTALPERRYPVFHIHLTLPPHEFDVNVHPQKKEVRFCHLSEVKEMIQKGISKALNTQHQKPFTSYFQENDPLPFKPISYTAGYLTEPVHLPLIKEPVAPIPFFAKEEKFTFKPHIPLVLGMIPFYILLEGEPALRVVDIQRAQKRIIYENVLTGFEKNSSGKQLLLVPLTQDFSSEEASLLEEHLTQMEESGFSIRRFGKGTFIIEAIPSFFKEKDVEPFLVEIINTFREEKKSGLNQALRAHLSAAAVKHITRENRLYSKLEAELLIESLFMCQQPYFTSTGQKIIADVSFEEIGKFFK